MKSIRRGMATLLCAATLLAGGSVMAQDTAALATERGRISVMIGDDVSRSMLPFAPDMDEAAFERALQHVIKGGEPLLSQAEVAAIAPALRQRAAARSGRQVPGLAPGSVPPDVDKTKVGLMLGADVARNLGTIASELDLSIFMQSLRNGLSGGKSTLTDQQREDIGQALQQRMRAAAARAGEDNRKAGADFLAANRSAKGVFATGSGLQYQVLKQGTGRRPASTDTVRVHYHGTLLNGTVFDSSVDRGQPTEFGLRQVIAGWTEGLTLMSVGAKYRFWIPSELAYGERGSPPLIGPNSVLVFDVELLDIL